MRQNQKQARVHLRLPSPDTGDPVERAWVWRQRSSVRGVSCFYPKRELLRLAALLYGDQHGAVDRATGEWRTLAEWIDRDPAESMTIGAWFRRLETFADPEETSKET